MPNPDKSDLWHVLSRPALLPPSKWARFNPCSCRQVRKLTGLFQNRAVTLLFILGQSLSEPSVLHEFFLRLLSLLTPHQICLPSVDEHRSPGRWSQGFCCYPFNSSKSFSHERGGNRQILSSLTNAHFFSVELFLQLSGFECLQPSVWVSVSCSESGRL